MPINKKILITANKFVKEISKRKLGDLFLLIFLVLITFFVNSFLLTIHPLSYVGDAQRYNGYQAYIMKYSLEHFGQFGLWDQFLSSGMSWISHPGGGQFSPTDWIVITFFKDPMFGSRMIFFFHTFTASIAAYFFLRAIGLQKLTSFFIAITGIANLYIFLFVANGWFEEFFGLTIIPLTTGLLLFALKRKSYFFAVLAAFSMSFHFFLNSYYVFHYHVIILLVILFLLGVKEVVNFLKDKKKKFNNLISFIFLNSVFWTVFIGISAIKLIPLLEFRNLSVRSKLPLSVVESPGHILDTSVLYESLRYFFIDKSHTNWLSHLSNDIGAFLIIFAILYFLLKRSFIFFMFFTVLIVGIWGFLANKAPIDFYSLMYHFLPGFDSNNYPYRFIIIIRFAFFACIALGLDLLIKQKKILFIKLLGIFLGFILATGVVSSIKPAYDGLTYTKDYPINNDKISDNNPENFLIVLKNIVKNSYPDGRVRSTGFYPRAPVSNINSLRAELPSVHHSYDPIVPTYQYGIILAGTTKDSLYLTKNRYKIFSVLNAKFQVQSNSSFEYWGCRTLMPDTFEITYSDLPSTGVCNFLENRLKLIYKDEKGAIYKDKDVLPKFSLIQSGILIVGDNRLNDFSGFISKKIMFHPSFDEHKISLLSGGSAFADDYDLDTLKQFSAIILVDSKIRNKEKIDKMLSSYKDQGGQVIELHSKWIKYDYLHERSDSLFTNNPAWNYSKGDSKKLAPIFSSISAAEEKPGKIEINKFTPEESIYKITTSDDNQVFQFSDSFYPGWKAEIDGEKTTIYMADGLVKSVILPGKGTHIVRFYYAPDSLRNGIKITIVTLLISISLLLHYYKKDLSSFIKSMFMVKKTIISKFFETKNKLPEALKTFKNTFLNNSNTYLGVIVLFTLICIYFPVFSNTVTSGGDLPLYFDTYIKSLSIPHVWNPHWPSGLGGNQAIILPLKFYIQLPIPLLINYLGLSWEIIEKIFLFGVFLFLSIFSSYFLTRSWIGTLIYTSNTYILMVFTGGQIGIALSYAVVPLVLALFIRLYDRFSLSLILITGLIFSLEIIFDQRIAYLTLLAVLIFTAVNLPSAWLFIKKRFVLIFLLPIIILLLNAFWILPLLYSKLVGINALQIIERTPGNVGFFSFAFLENTISLLHPNFPENIFGKVSFMKPEFLIIPILAFSSLLFIGNGYIVTWLHDQKKKLTTQPFNHSAILFFAILGLIGAFLAKGTNEPFGEAYVWLFNNFPGFSFFRDPTKFYIFVALSYSVIIPFALKEISNKLKENFRAKGFYLLSIVFLIFWIFTIRPVFLNQVGGILKENKIPKEYINLKKQIESQPGFFRTLWMPLRSRFGYFSDTHPSIDGYDLFGRIGEATMAGKFQKQEVLSLLSDMSVKYVIVPSDSKGEIFLTDRKYDESKYEEMIEGLFAIPQLKQVSNFGKLTLFELQNQKDHFFIESANNVSISQINYQAVSPVKYLVNVKGAKRGDILIFSESYDLGWRLSSPDIKIFPIPYRNTLNGFVLPDDGDYAFELFYDPQKASNIGFIISFAVLGIIISTLIFLKIRKRSVIF